MIDVKETIENPQSKSLSQYQNYVLNFPCVLSIT